jgi:hypothetical protein
VADGVADRHGQPGRRGRTCGDRGRVETHHQAGPRSEVALDHDRQQHIGCRDAAGSNNRAGEQGGDVRADPQDQPGDHESEQHGNGGAQPHFARQPGPGRGKRAEAEHRHRGQDGGRWGRQGKAAT